MGDQAFNSEIQLEPHLESDGPLLSRLVSGHNHTSNSVGWMTFQVWPRLQSDITSLCQIASEGSLSLGKEGFPKSFSFSPFSSHFFVCHPLCSYR